MSDLDKALSRPVNSKEARIFDLILPAFEDAVEFSSRSDWREEVGSLNAALELARSASMLKGPKVYQSMRSQIQAAGLIFRGAEPIGDITPISGDQIMLQNQSILAGLAHRSDVPIAIYSDRVIAGSEVHPIDENTTATVFLDGAEQVVQRPTLTRMALLSPLPGSALAPGMALQKKTKVDTREVTFSIASAEWQFTCRTHPTLFADAKSIAERVNAIASKLEKATRNEPQNVDSLSQLKQLKELLDSGAISESEFQAMKSKILGQF